MKTISIHVPPSLATSFEQADESKRRIAEIYINSWLSDFFNTNKPNEKLLDIMKKASDEATRNGFNPDIIDDILKDE